MTKEIKVLVVDDSAFAHRVIGQHLADSEFKIVASAKSSLEAVQKFKECSPDVMLLDVILPDRTGVETLRDIFQINPGALVLMTSSLGTEETVTESLTLGAKAFIQKPVEKATLLEALRKLFVNG